MTGHVYQFFDHAYTALGTFQAPDLAQAIELLKQRNGYQTVELVDHYPLPQNDKHIELFLAFDGAEPRCYHVDIDDGCGKPVRSP